jgi:exo-1,4-beta-D-glucosaminidase
MHVPHANSPLVNAPNRRTTTVRCCVIANRTVPATLLLSLVLGAGCSSVSTTRFPTTIPVTSGWSLQSSRDCLADGSQISEVGFATDGWYRTSVPATVMAALMANGKHQDIFDGRTLESIDTAHFKVAWWYRTEVTLERLEGRHVRLVLDGVNYSANVWCNGAKVADRGRIIGAFRRFELDLTDHVRNGVNAFAIEVFPPEPGSFTVGFVDWNPPPPDRNMGLFRGVTLRVTGTVGIDDVFVHSTLPDGRSDVAALTVQARVTNLAHVPVRTVLRGGIEKASFSCEITLQPAESRIVTLGANDIPALRVRNPRLWWPRNLGEPNLYELHLRAEVGSAPSDERKQSFGIRTVADYTNQQGHRGYMINGTPVLIRGAGWVDDLFLREDATRLEAEVRYAAHMNLNTLRLEGFWGASEALYDLCDRYGILLMTGWSCQWEWQEYLGKSVDEFGGVETPEEIELVGSSLADQVRWLRNHPSIFVWILGSDRLPRPALETRYREDLALLDRSRPLLAACSAKTSIVSGPTGVKMNGPYDYVTPNYWYEDRTNGGAFGFNTETGPGPQPPVLESLERMMPQADLWPIGDMWAYHCARKEFNTPKRYLRALDARYGPSTGVVELARKSQLASYEAMRAMFEAFAVNRPNTTGIIQWMCNSAWPKVFWQLYDYYLVPTGAFYGARKANQPQSLVYNYGDGAVYATNGTPAAQTDLIAEIRVFGPAGVGEELYEVRSVGIPADRAVKVWQLDKPWDASPVFFLDLRLKRRDGGLVASNFYWLSVKKDVLDPSGTTWFVTPNSEYASFEALATLAPTELQSAMRVKEEGKTTRVLVTLRNHGRELAFGVELALVGAASGRLLVPVLWDDNYFALRPGEEREVSAELSTEQARTDSPRLAISCWNSRGRS